MVYLLFRVLSIVDDSLDEKSFLKQSVFSLSREDFGFIINASFNSFESLLLNSLN